MPNEYGIYVANNNEEDTAFLKEHFVKGTKWVIYEYGDIKGIFTVGDRFTLGGIERIRVTRDRDGWQGEVFPYWLEAKPCESVRRCSTKHR